MQEVRKDWLDAKLAILNTDGSLNAKRETFTGGSLKPLYDVREKEYFLTVSWADDKILANAT